MNALSLWQPWASLIAVGAKLIETRDWGTNYKGPLAIQAASKLHNDAVEAYFASRGMQRAIPVDSLHTLPRKAIVCVANLDDCVKVSGLFSLKSQLGTDAYFTDDWEEFGDYSTGRVLWLLSNVKKLKEPVTVNGRQSMWKLTPDIVAQIEAQL